MKKFVLILGIFLFLNLCACKNNKADDTQKFVNPIFYQPLRPLGRTSTWTYLTPTVIKSMTPSDKNKFAMTGKCELIENKKNFIKLLCNIEWNEPENHFFDYSEKYIYTYELQRLFLRDCLKIEEKKYNLKEGEFVSISHYCVTPPDYSASESD